VHIGPKCKDSSISFRASVNTPWSRTRPPFIPPSPTFRDEALPHALSPLLARAAQDDDSGRKNWKARLAAATAALGWEVGGGEGGDTETKRRHLVYEVAGREGERKGGNRATNARTFSRLFCSLSFCLTAFLFTVLHMFAIED